MDLEAGEERLQVTLHVDDFAVLADVGTEEPIALELVEVGGNTQVMFQGELLVELQGATGVVRLMSAQMPLSPTIAGRVMRTLQL